MEKERHSQKNMPFDLSKVNGKLQNIMKPKIWIIFALLLSRPTFALENIDLHAKTGAIAGKVRRETSFGLNQDTASLGGILLSLGLRKDINAHMAMTTDLGFLLDLVNTQISRQELGGSLQYQVLGGPRLIHIENPLADFKSRSNSQLSLLASVAVVSYSLSTKDLSSQLTGSTYELRGGILYRYGALGLDLQQTLYSLASSKERLTGYFTAIGLLWMI